MLKRVLIRLLTHFQLRVLYNFRRTGKNVRLGRRLFVYKGRVALGDNVFVGGGCYLDGEIDIGNDVMLANCVAIVGGDHEYKTVGLPIFAARREHWKRTIINDNVWIGHGAIIMNGLTIGRGAIVAAGSVVTKDVAPFEIVAGVPARTISVRFNAEEQRRHEEALSIRHSI